VSKLRCNLQRPTCSRCQSRSIECQYFSQNQEQLPTPPAHEDQQQHQKQGQDQRTPSVSPSPDLALTPDRKRVLLGQPGTPNTQMVVRHTVQYVVRLLRVWPRMLASYSTTGHLPPIVHHLQLTNGMPAPLANCCTLVRMWADHSEGGSRTLVKSTIIEEIRRLFREVSKNALIPFKSAVTVSPVEQSCHCLSTM
jgi:hypothetical protein